MPQEYIYELWNGKDVVDVIKVGFPIMGRELIVNEVSLLKETYNSKKKSFIVPITTRVIKEDYRDRTSRVVLDVRRKTKRQIEVIKRVQIL